MKLIRIKISKNTVVNHLIFDATIDCSSYAASILLHNYYKDLDEDYQREKDWRYLFIAKRTFLRHQKKEGKWYCHYCGIEMFNLPKRGVRVQNLKKCVTIDHKIPVCRCSDKTDSKNFLVSCHKCNIDKGSTEYKIFTK
jgi:hypothetical protein